MRELSLEDQELIAGGLQTVDAMNQDIVVTADPGDDGFYPTLPVFDGGGGGGGGDWGGDGGGGGDYTPPTEPEPEEIVVTAPRPTADCPVNTWWPNMLEDWGDVQALTPPIGNWTQFWNDNGTWCFYDDSDNLQGTFVHDPNGQETLSLSNVNGQPSFNLGAAGLSGGVATNDSTSVAVTIKGSWTF